MEEQYQQNEIDNTNIQNENSRPSTQDYQSI